VRHAYENTISDVANALIAQRHPWSRCLAISLMVAAVAYPNWAVRAADEAADLARLSLEVQRAEDIRAVKRLQISYAHYAQFGLWSEMALLFTSDAEAVYGADYLKGRAAIRTYLLTTWATAARVCQPVAYTPCSKTRRS
jgi:hypothetical protein